MRSLLVSLFVSVPMFVATTACTVDNEPEPTDESLVQSSDALKQCPQGTAPCHGRCQPDGLLCQAGCPKGTTLCHGQCQPAGLSCSVCPTGQVLCNGKCQPKEMQCTIQGCPAGERLCHGQCLPDELVCIAN